MPYLAGARGRLHYRHWQLDRPQAVLALLPGVGQHSGHYHRFARALAAADIELWALDTSGHGLSEGDPERPGILAELAADAGEFLDQVRTRATAPLFLMGHSLGAATALAVLREAEPGDYTGLVLCGTPQAVLEGRSPKSARGAASSNSIRTRTLSRANATLATENESDWPGPALPAGLPVLIVHGADDRRAPVDPVRAWAHQVSAEFHLQPDAGHDLLHEPGYAAVTTLVADWIDTRTHG